MVDADPIRIFLIRWMIETGDPIEVVARGFDLDAVLIHDIVSGETRWLSFRDESVIRGKLGCLSQGHALVESEDKRIRIRAHRP